MWKKPNSIEIDLVTRPYGAQVEINNFRDAFEKGEDPLADVTDASDINSVAGVMKLYLRELREPLFHIQYFDHFMELARKGFRFSSQFVMLSSVILLVYQLIIKLVPPSKFSPP